VRSRPAMRCRDSSPISRNRRLSPAPFDQVEAAPAHAGLSQIHRGTRSQRGLACYVQCRRKGPDSKRSALRFWKRARLQYRHETQPRRRAGLGRVVPDDAAPEPPAIPRRIEVAQKMAGHSNAKTTGLYDRRNDDVSVGEVERIGI
jgi:hypothetical protein